MRPLATVLMLALTATPLAAQNDDAPRRGKIDGVEREKDKDRSDGGGCNCGSAWWMDWGEGVIHLFNPHGAGRGYLPYPYAPADTASPGALFAVRRTERGRSYATVALSYFNDEAATLEGARLAFEFGAALAYASLEASGYREPLASETDHLYTWRAGMGVLPRIGPGAILKFGIAARGLSLDDGSSSIGPELEGGIQILPRRPFGLTVVGRVAALSWDGGGDTFPLRELNTTGSLFLGRFEIQAGWHWMKIGAAPAFGGPTLGSRIWF